MKIHNVFHVYLLEYYKDSSIVGRSQPSIVHVEIHGNEKYEVEKILNFKLVL
jgi:hypothetical protein